MTENNDKKIKEEKTKCENKVSYRIYAEADFVRRTYGKNEKMQIYRCPFCENWHLKNRKKK